MDIKDKTCVVTGAASGIGRALSIALAEQGAAHVVCADVNLQGAQDTAKRAGGSAFQVDVSKESDIAAVIDDTETRIGPIDLFVSNAGIATPGGVDAPNDDWQRIWDINVMAHVWAARHLVPLMADGLVLPYLDIPFQHAHPDTLRRMARPAAAERTLDRIAEWRAICPDITLRSTFIVGYPGETEEEFQTLLDWLDTAQLDRVGCFQYENVAGARSNDLPDHVPQPVKEERWHRFMEKAQAISAAKLAAKVGTRLNVIVDLVEDDAATCRTMADAPEIDGNLFIDAGHRGLSPSRRRPRTAAGRLLAGLPRPLPAGRLRADRRAAL